jgi:hypothetical protein
MPDWPALAVGGSLVSVSTLGPEGLLGYGMLIRHVNAAANIWTTANTAVYMPFTIQSPMLAQKMAVDVSVQSGNLDLGIYSEKGARLVSMGSTAVAVAGLQVADIADTWLPAGTYFAAMNCDNITASFFGLSTLVTLARSGGLLQQAVGAVALPSPATFAAWSTTRAAPAILVSGVATV